MHATGAWAFKMQRSGEGSLADNVYFFSTCTALTWIARTTQTYPCRQWLALFCCKFERFDILLLLRPFNMFPHKLPNCWPKSVNHVWQHATRLRMVKRKSGLFWGEQLLKRVLKSDTLMRAKKISLLHNLCIFTCF